MVKLEEVEDEDLLKPQEGPVEGEDEWDTDSGRLKFALPLNALDIKLILPFHIDDSDADSVTDNESFLDRVSALKDILPPSQRRHISNAVSTTTSWVTTGGVWAGKALWIISTSALLLGVPWALAYTEEQQYAEMEREARLQEQGNQV